MVDKNAVLIELGGLIYVARKRRGFTQAELANLMTLTRASVANIEVGRQNLSLVRLMEFAEVLAVPVKALIPTGGVDHRARARMDRAHTIVSELEAKLEQAKAKLERASQNAK